MSTARALKAAAISARKKSPVNESRRNASPMNLAPFADAAERTEFRDRWKALGAIGRAVRKFDAREADAASPKKAPQSPRDPLLDIVVNMPAVTHNLGPVDPTPPPAVIPKGAKAWAATETARGALTMRVWYRGGKEYLAAAAAAIFERLHETTKRGAKVAFRVIRYEVMHAAAFKGYVAIFRIVATPAPGRSLQGLSR